MKKIELEGERRRQAADLRDVAERCDRVHVVAFASMAGALAAVAATLEKESAKQCQ